MVPRIQAGPTWTRRFTSTEIEHLFGDPTKPMPRVEVKPESVTRSWADQELAIRRMTDTLISRLSQDLDREGASEELARLSAIVRGHLSRADKGKDKDERGVDVDLT